MDQNTANFGGHFENLREKGVYEQTRKEIEKRERTQQKRDEEDGGGSRSRED